MKRRLPPALFALLAASLSAGLVAWHQARSQQRPPALVTSRAAAPSPPPPPPSSAPPAPSTGPTAPAGRSSPPSSSHPSLLPLPTEPPPAAHAGLLPPAPPTPPDAAPRTQEEPEARPAPMFRGDPARRHRSAFLGPSAPERRFAADVGGPITAMPALLPGGDLIVASLSGKVLRLSPEGAVVWTADLGERIYSSPLITGDLVVLGSDADRVTALSVATGKPRWTLPVDGDADTGGATGAGGSILIAAGKVVYALRTNGTILWRFKAKKKVYASPAVAADGTAYVGSQDDHLYAIAKDGSLLFRRDLGADVDCAAAVGDNGLVYAGTDGGQVVALDAGGSIKWRAQVSGYVRGGLTVTRDGAVLAGTYGPAPRVVALDADTGAERWSFPIQGTGAPEFGIHGAPLEDPAGNLYFGAQDDKIYALDRAGRLRWTFETGGDVDAPLTIGPGGVLYAGSYDGRLYALR